MRRLTDRHACRPEFDDVVFDVGSLAGETPAVQASAVFNVVRRRRDEVAFPGGSAATHSDANHVKRTSAKAVFERSTDRERRLTTMILDVCGEQWIGRHPFRVCRDQYQAVLRPSCFCSYVPQPFPNICSAGGNGTRIKTKYRVKNTSEREKAHG